MADENGEGLSQHPEAVRARERRKEGKGGKRRRGVPSQSEIRTRIDESLRELAAALEDRDPELSRVLKRDGPKMADLLAKWGEHPKAPAPLKIAVVVVAEVLEPLRAFGGTVRLLLRRLREARLARQQGDYDDEAGERPWSEPPEPPFVEPEPLAQPSTPERFRVE